MVVSVVRSCDATACIDVWTDLALGFDNEI